MSSTSSSLPRKFDSGGCERVHHGFQTGSALVTAASSSSVLNSSGAPSAHLPSAATTAFRHQGFRAILPAAISPVSPSAAPADFSLSADAFPDSGAPEGTFSRRRLSDGNSYSSIRASSSRVRTVATRMSSALTSRGHVRLYRDQLAREGYMALGGPEQLLLARGSSPIT